MALDKITGVIIKARTLKLTPDEMSLYRKILKTATEEKWSLEEFTEAWVEEQGRSFLLPITSLKHDFATLSIDDKIIVYNGEILLPMEELEHKSPGELKNTIEFTGVGKIITPFSLNFRDYNKDFGTTDFFNLNPDECIINNTKIIVLENNQGLNPSKLTGRAAELARKKGLV